MEAVSLGGDEKGEGRIANLWTTSGLSRSLQECHGNPAQNSRMGLRAVDNCDVRHVGGGSVRAASCHQQVAPWTCSCAVFARRNCTTMAQLMASRRQLPGSDAQRRRNCLTMAQVEQGAEAQVRDSGAGEQGWRSWRKPGTRRCGPQGGRLRTGHPAPCHPVHAAIRRGSQTTAVTPGRRQFAIPAEES